MLHRKLMLDWDLGFTPSGLFQLFPYKIMAMNELKQQYYTARIQFYNWLLWSMHDGSMDLQLLFLTEEACVYPSGDIIRSIWMRGDRIHMPFKKCHYTVKADVYCSVSAWSVVAWFFQQFSSVHEQYIECFFHQWTAEGRQLGYFQWYNATAYIADKFVGVGFEVLTAVVMKSSTCCLLHAGFFFDSEDRGGMFLQNIGWLSVDYMAWYPNKWNYSSLWLLCMRYLRTD
jgi:hypothetical protein